MTKLFEDIRIGNLKLNNRIAMAPMTRSRALVDGTPSELAIDYYGQRSSVGLIISEGTQPSDDGQGYSNTPGIYTREHIDGWKKITSKVHSEGGKLFIQLMHVGRVAHPDNTPHHRQPVAPSAISPNADIFTPGGMKPIPTPRALDESEISDVVNEFRLAARAAVEAGADGVEIHGANGYLIQQFISENSNHRQDKYGGSIENRSRFAIEVAKAVVEEIGAERTGIRFSPQGTLNGIEEGNSNIDLYRYLITELNELNLAYLHVMNFGNESFMKEIRELWSQILLMNRPGRPLDQLSLDVDNELADIATVGTWLISNPDFVERVKTNSPLTEPDRNTMYAGGASGYIDYPALQK